MLVLGFDPSLTNFGWAIHDTEATGKKRCINRGRFRTKLSDFSDEVGRYIYLREQLRSLLKEHPKIRYCGIEHPVFNEFYSEGMFGLYLFSLEALKTEKRNTVLFAPPQVKSLAKECLQRPKGWKMTKADMVDAAKEDAGSGRWNHNEADAYWVSRGAGSFWKLYLQQIQDTDLTPVECKMFTEIKTYKRGKKAGKTEYKGFLHRENDRFFLWGKTDGKKSK